MTSSASSFGRSRRYGTDEAIVLAAVPVAATWSVEAAVGWTSGGFASVASAVLAVVGALLVILVHHLGYSEIRQASARPMLAGALFACGVQALAFVVTGNVLVPVVAHVVLHAQLLLRGNPPPPKEERPADRGERRPG